MYIQIISCNHYCLYIYSEVDISMINDFAVVSGGCKNIFWFILTIFMVFLWIGNTYFILKAYIKYEVTISIDITSSRSLEFPAVTVCNQNVLRQTAVDTESGLSSSYTSR